jgi:hypothetical protein
VSIDDRFVHTLIIERATDGAVDDYNNPTRTWSTLSTVKGLIQPKTAREVAQFNQAGAVVSTFTIYLRPTEIQPADRVRTDDAPVAGTYEIDGVRNEAGLNHHLKADCRMVQV